MWNINHDPSRRRIFKKALGVGNLIASAAILEACASSTKPNRAMSAAEKDQLVGKVQPSLEEKIKSEVARVAEQVLYKGDEHQKITAEYYLGRPLTDIRSTYLPLQTYLTRDPASYADTLIEVEKVNENQTVLFKTPKNTEVQEVSAVSGLKMKIGFSLPWLSAPDSVKALMMHKEFLHYRIWPRYAGELYEDLHRIGVILGDTGNPSKDQKEDSIAMLALKSSKKTLELFDYSAYLLVMPWARRLLLTGNQSEKQALGTTDFGTLMRQIDEKGIKGDVNVDSPDFTQIAWGQDSQWADIIYKHRNLE